MYDNPWSRVPCPFRSGGPALQLAQNASLEEVFAQHMGQYAGDKYKVQQHIL